MIMWSNTWFDTWSNMWPTNIIFKKQTNLIFIIIKTHHYQLITLVARQALTLLLKQAAVIIDLPLSDTVIINLLTDIARLLQTSLLSSSTLSTKSSISADQAVPLAHQLIAKLHLKSIRAWSSLLLAYQLIVVPTPFQSGGRVRNVFGYQKSHEWSGKRMADWTQSKNLLLERQHQLFYIDLLSEVNPSW